MLRLLIGVVIGMLISATVTFAQGKAPWIVPVTGRDYASLSDSTRFVYATGVYTGMTAAAGMRYLGADLTSGIVDCLGERGSSLHAIQHVLDDFLEVEPKQLEGPCFFAPLQLARSMAAAM